jgi:uncharacterized cupin superfamily protein
MTLAPGVDANIFPPHRAGSREYVAVETGTLTQTLDGTEYALKTGDSMYHDSRRAARRLVVQTVSGERAARRVVG